MHMSRTDVLHLKVMLFKNGTQMGQGRQSKACAQSINYKPAHAEASNTSNTQERVAHNSYKWEINYKQTVFLCVSLHKICHVSCADADLGLK